ncbi:MAG TPA: phytanoyl-CoA dioxygenase family protein, partial [Acidimicrobiales bacterium]|nr:phytanoyl-CoA dioxygenase family protein [Acidimicrobiales bacterium]
MPAAIAELGLERNVSDLATIGYTVVENAAPIELFDRLRAAIIRVTDEHHARGSEPFNFGPNTSMVYRLLAHDDAVAEAVLTPKLVALMTHLLGPGYVVNTITGSMLHQGSNAGHIHADNQFFPEPFPPQIHVATAIWCLDDFSGELGSTRVVPGSHHKFRHPRPGEGRDDSVAIEAPRGSIAIWTGHTWHCSGGRTAPGTRIALHTAFSRPHIRRFESYTDDELARITALDERLVRLAGADLPYDQTGDSPDPAKLL